MQVSKEGKQQKVLPSCAVYESAVSSLNSETFQLPEPSLSFFQLSIPREKQQPICILKEYDVKIREPRCIVDKQLWNYVNRI